MLWGLKIQNAQNRSNTFIYIRRYRRRHSILCGLIRGGGGIIHLEVNGI